MNISWKVRKTLFNPKKPWGLLRFTLAIQCLRLAVWFLPEDSFEFYQLEMATEKLFANWVRRANAMKQATAKENQ